jgi:hypothetical protein
MLPIISHVIDATSLYRFLSIIFELMPLSFFAHLVDVLGAKDFLAPVIMLLLEKMANRIVRQPAVEVPNTLSLPMSIFQHNSYSLQIHVSSCSS